jgi:DnaK suppressor protein
MSALENELHSLLALLDMDEAKIVELDQSRMGRISRIDAILHQQLAKSRENEARIRFEVLKKTKDRLLEAPEFFGFCEECDERIPLGRLLLKPEALFCVPCLSG